MAPETETADETKKRAVAVHELLDSNAQVVDDEESANGIRYTLVENQEKFEWLAKQATSEELVMLAVFGAKTLATNVASQIRNNVKGAGSADEQINAVRERFTLIRGGDWLDRTREGAGLPKIDKDALANAICLVFIATGKRTEAQVKNGEMAKVRARLDDEPAYLRKARQVPAVATEYAKLTGKAQVSVDDLI